jgi:lysophospholipase L1-like esterase
MLMLGEARMGTSRSTLVANLALAATSLAVVFGVAEAALAWRDWRWRAGFENRLQGGLPCTARADDARLLYTVRPHACSSNSQGYPDAEHSLSKPDGVFRVVVIGDSVAVGQGVAREERFVTRLAVNPGDRRLEVVLLARPGYSTSQELVILESEAFSYAPDLIVWVYCLNDPADPIFHDANGELGRYYFRPRSYALHYLRKLLFRVRENWARRDCGDEYHVALHCVYREPIEANVRAIGRLAQAHGTPVLFTIVPVFDRDTTALEGIHQWLSDIATEAGLVPVDLLRVFRDAPPGRFALQGPANLDPWHPTAAGHAVIADTLSREIQQYLDTPLRAMPRRRGP